LTQSNSTSTSTNRQLHVHIQLTSQRPPYSPIHTSPNRKARVKEESWANSPADLSTPSGIPKIPVGFICGVVYMWGSCGVPIGNLMGFCTAGSGFQLPQKDLHPGVCRGFSTIEMSPLVLDKSRPLPRKWYRAPFGRKLTAMLQYVLLVFARVPSGHRLNITFSCHHSQISSRSLIGNALCVESDLTLPDSSQSCCK